MGYRYYLYIVHKEQTIVYLQPFYWWAKFSHTVYFRQGLVHTLGLTNDVIDGGQPRAKPLLCKANSHLRNCFK